MDDLIKKVVEKLSLSVDKAPEVYEYLKMQFAVSNYEIISNIYVEMQEKRMQNGIFKERCLFDIQNIIKDIS